MMFSEPNVRATPIKIVAKAQFTEEESELFVTFCNHFFILLVS